MKKIIPTIILAILSISLHAQLQKLDADVSIGYVLAADIRNTNNYDLIFSGVRKINSVNTGIGELYINENGVLTKTNASEYKGIDRILNTGRYSTYRIADINGDGNIDIFFSGRQTGNDRTNSPGLMLGDGNGNFTAASASFYPMSGFRSVEIADFNHDGLMDFFFIKEGAKGVLGNYAAVYYQQKHGPFIVETKSFQYININPDIVTQCVDFNNDGYMDLVIQAGEDYYYREDGTRATIFMQNNRDNTFIKVEMPDVIKKGYGNAAFADIDGDGWIDMAMGGDGGTNDHVHIYKNNNGIYELKTTLPDFRHSAPVTSSMVFVDWDNDGSLSLFVGGWKSGDSNTPNTKRLKCTDPANFTFEEMTDPSLEQIGSVNFNIGDFNNDGRPDLVYMGSVGPRYSYNNRSGVYLNNKSNTPTKPATPINARHSINDKSITLEWDESPANLRYTYNIALREKKSGKWFYSPLADLSTGKRKYVAPGNAGRSNSYEIKNLPNGDYEWAVQTINISGVGSEFSQLQEFSINTNNLVTFDLSVTYAPILLGDFRSSENIDILMTGEDKSNVSQGGYFINTWGDFEKADVSKYTSMDYLTQNGTKSFMRPIDIDGDGNLDIIYSRLNINASGILLGDGAGNFKETKEYPTMDKGFGYAEIADFNNDGLMDIFYIKEKLGNAVMYYAKNEKEYEAHTLSFAGINVNSDIFTTSVDFNNDGFLDLVLITGWDNILGMRGCIFMKNNGDKSFTQVDMPNVIRKGFGTATFADINGDGWPDMLLNGDGGPDGEKSNYFYRLYKNNMGNFEPVQEFKYFRQRFFGGGSHIVDWDNDGKLDLIISGYDEKGSDFGKIRLFKGVDPENFTFEEVMLDGAVGLGEVYLDIADFDSDGFIDLAFSGKIRIGQAENLQGVYFNNTAKVDDGKGGYANANQPPTVPYNLTTEQNRNTFTISWDESTDPEGAPNITYNLSVRNKDTGKWVYSPLSYMEDGLRKVSQKGNMHYSRNRTLDFGFLEDGNYAWTVQAIDANGLASSFAPEEEFSYKRIYTDEELKAFVYQDGLKANIDTKGKIEEVQLFSMSGAMLYSGKNTEIDLSHLSTGMYILVVKVKYAKDQKFKVIRR